jgi:hypothetical protein
VKRFSAFFFSLSKIYQISWIVTILHLTFFLVALTNYWLIKKEKKQQAMIVRTVLAPKPKQTAISSHPKKAVQSSPLKTKVKKTPQKKQVAPSKAPLKQKNTHIKKENTHKIDETLLDEITKSLENFDLAEPKKAAKLSIPQTITCKPEIESKSSQDTSYAENLIAMLTNHLDLPEFGSVKICLTLNSSGSVVAFKILEENSHKNSEFLKNRLHELTFPCFNDFEISDSELEFTIVFRNVEKKL